MNLAFVVPRYRPEGGSEAEGRPRDLAQRLRERGHSVEILTTTAVDPRTWENVLDATTSDSGGTTVRRFPVSRVDGAGAPIVRGLLEHLRHHRRDFDAALYFADFSWAQDHGLTFSPEANVLVPGETGCPVAERLHGVTVVVDTLEEQVRLGESPSSESRRSVVIGPGVALPPEPMRSEAPSALQGLAGYVVLAGPLEARDGFALAVDAFLRAERESRAPLTLVLIGRGRISLGENIHVRHLGDLSEAAKEQVIAGALAVLVPARREFLAPAALHAWSLARPVIAHGAGQVMRALVARANGGAPCETSEELAAALEVLAADAPLADALGRQGRGYVAAHYSWPVVLEKWEALFSRVAARGAAAA